MGARAESYFSRLLVCTSSAGSSTASRASIRDGWLRLTTVAGGPTTTGTQILSSNLVACQQQRAPGGPRCTERGALAQDQVEAAQQVCTVSVQFPTLIVPGEKVEEFVAGRSDAKIMFDLCSDTESPKTIKKLRDVVDSLRARLRTGGLRSQHAASDVQALQK